MSIDINALKANNEQMNFARQQIDLAKNQMFLNQMNTGIAAAQTLLTATKGEKQFADATTYAINYLIRCIATVDNTKTEGATDGDGQNQEVQ